MSNILQNFRTPQNMNNMNQQLSMYTNQNASGGSSKSPKELPGINSHHSNSQARGSGSTRHTDDAGGGPNEQQLQGNY